MNPATQSIEQQARITQIKGNVQLIRDGFFLPAQAGQLLLPGDRLMTADNARAVVQFTGVQDALVIEQGAAATFNLEVVDADQVPQWIATNLEGEGVFFENSQLARNQADLSDNGPTLGLFGTGSTGNEGIGNEGTGYPVLEITAGLLATAAIFGDYDSNDTDGAATSTVAAGNPSETGTPPATNPPAGQNPEPTPGTEPQPNPNTPAEPAANPLDAVLAPVTGLLEGSPLGLLTTLVPLGSLPLPGQGGPADALSGALPLG